ncbi:MAG: di-trans,poly-cis-decaprenylcistransferase [Clostridia bacterium]|nr:di-trans,poly-cis-decaprenylcistransferase [Clostridia bacterium]
MSNLPPKEFMPKHVGLIMDGNGRWARERGLDRSAGHAEGAKVMKRIMDYGHDIGLSAMTFYAFSTENWKRPQHEVDVLMDLFKDYLKEADETKYEREKRGFYLRVIGDISALPLELQLLAKSVQLVMKDKSAMVVNLAINYGGQQEITRACRQIAEEVKKGKLSPKDITEETIESHLYTAGLPAPDLIIRPSGELRLSNFLTWQSAYSELWFDNIAWPDFTPDDLDRAIMDYAKRDRRFGGLSEKDH